MKEEKLFKVKYRWHSGNTYITQVVNETTLEKMKKGISFVIISVQEY